MKKEQVYIVLHDILIKFYSNNKKFETLWDTSKDVPLTGAIWNITAIDMTYLFLEVEKQFQIHIDASKLDNYQFNTVNLITDTICQYLNQQQNINK